MVSDKITLWNANGLSQHKLQVQAYLNIAKIDILLISETHFTNRSYCKIPAYKIYSINHPSENVRAGSAIIIKNTIKYYDLQPCKEE